MRAFFLSAAPLFERATRSVISASRMSPATGRVGLGNFRCSGIRHGVFLIGDAVERFDPIGGMGMTHAFYSAALARHEIVGVIESGDPLMHSISRYEEARLPFANQMRAFTRFTYASMRGFSSAPFALPIASTGLGKVVARYFAPKVPHTRGQEL